MAYIERRVTGTGEISYRVQIRLNGHPTQSATFKRKTDARRWGEKIETDIRDGKFFPTSRAQQKTLSDLVDRYISDILPRKPKSADTQRGQLIWWQHELGEYHISDLTTDVVARARDKLLTDMERALADRPWLLGDAFSLADLNLTPYITRIEALALDPMFESRPRVQDWFARIKSRASYDEAFTKWLNPYYQKMMRERGEDAWPDAAEMLSAA